MTSRSFPSDGPNRVVAEFIRSLPDLTGTVAIDIPAGDGRASWEFARKGAEVIALDLFPEFNQVDEIDSRFGDMMDVLPVDDGVADYVVCQEGIEHIPNPLMLLCELNRVLKPGGTLILTTPSRSHIRGRLSYFLFESDSWRRMPPTEIDSVWFADEDADRLYFGHLFEIPVHQLLTLTSIAGFRTTHRLKTKLGTTSTLLGLPLWPLLAGATLLTSWLASRKEKTDADGRARQIRREHIALNLSPGTLFRKHTAWVLRKEMSVAEKRRDLASRARARG